MGIEANINVFVDDYFCSKFMTMNLRQSLCTIVYEPCQRFHTLDLMFMESILSQSFRPYFHIYSLSKQLPVLSLTSFLKILGETWKQSKNHLSIYIPHLWETLQCVPLILLQ